MDEKQDLVAIAMEALARHPDLSGESPDFSDEVTERLIEELGRPGTVPAGAAEAMAARIQRRLTPLPRLVQFLERAGECVWSPPLAALDRFRLRVADRVRRVQAYFGRLASALTLPAAAHLGVTRGRDRDRGAIGRGEVSARIYASDVDEDSYPTTCEVYDLRHRAHGALAGKVRISAEDLATVPGLRLGQGLIEVSPRPVDADRQGRAAGPEPDERADELETRTSHFFALAGIGADPREFEFEFEVRFPRHSQGDGVDRHAPGIPFPVSHVVCLRLFEGQL